MALNYPAGLVDDARRRGHRAFCIAVGKDNIFFGTCPPAAQIHLLQMIEDARKRQEAYDATDATLASTDPAFVTPPIPGMEAEPEPLSYEQALKVRMTRLKAEAAANGRPAEPKAKKKRKPAGRSRRKKV